MEKLEKIIISKSNDETMALAERVASILPNGSTLLFSGDLGAGKTTFVRGLAKGLHIKDIVQSPTFNIMKIYMKGDRPLIHIDAYRLADNNVDIGLDEYIGYESGITVIEWPMYISDLLPEDAIEIEILNLGGNERELKIKCFDKALMEEFK